MAAAVDPATDAADGHAVAPTEADSRPGQCVGRYRLCAPLGAGSMGVVYEAYDPELDRKIALKLLHSSKRDPLSAARMLREAQALARLDHPNVVTVLDVGYHGEQVFLTMDFIEGETLSKWLRTKRSWQEIVDVFVGAGRGLAAAHAAGLVHRDFKPDNVMIARSGLVVVTDFGLVAPAGMSGTTSPLGRPDESESESSADLFSRPLTVSGRLLGTPAYMAPEQFSAEGASPLGDQFSFCVSLYEALYGKRPRTIEELRRLAYEHAEASRPSAPRVPTVPDWLRRAVLRGLEPRPNHRFASMEALLDALENRCPCRRPPFGRLVLGVGAFGIVAATVWSTADRPEACSGADEQLRGVWDDDERTAVRRTFDGLQRSYTSNTWRRAETLLDRRAEAWREAYTENCLATRVHGRQSEELMTARMRCLDRRRHEFESLVDALATGKADVVNHAIDAVLRLPDVAVCSDTDYVLAQVQPPSDERIAERVEEIRRELSRSWALRAAGRLSEASSLARMLVSEAQLIGYAPLVAEAELELGALRLDLGEYDLASALLRGAYFQAIEAGLDDVAAESALQLARVIGSRLHRYDEGLEWIEHARARIVPDRDVQRWATLLHVQAEVLLAHGRYDEAGPILQQALELRSAGADAGGLDMAETLVAMAKLDGVKGDAERAGRRVEEAVERLERLLGAEHPRLSLALEARGLIAMQRGDRDQARRDLERALQMRREVLGERHPLTGVLLSNLGTLYMHIEETELATSHYRAALTVLREALGEEHAHVNAVELNLAGVLATGGEYQESAETLERAIAGLESRLGPDHPHLWVAHAQLATVLYEMGRMPEARVHAERALAITSTAHGEDHPDVAHAQQILGAVALELGELDVAEHHLRLAIAVEHGQGALLDVVKVRAWTGMARLELARGAPGLAKATAERALTLHRDLSMSSRPLEEAGVRLVLAQAIVGSGGDRGEALQQAQQARRLAKQAGGAGKRLMTEAESWLAEPHRRPEVPAPD